MAKTPALALVLGTAVLGVIATCSPFGGADFNCSDNSQCTGMTGGVCEATGFCSFADPGCPGGQRYSDGPQANMCVGAPNPIDAPLGSEPPITQIDAPVIDAMSGMEMVQVMPFCIGTFVHVCVTTPPTAPVALAATISTDVGSGACRTDVTDGTNPITAYCVIAGTSITGSTTVTGTRPLIIISTTDMTIASIDAASHRGGTVGPAANATGCAATGAPANGGAGGGGGFGTKGGDGGDGPPPATGGTGGGTSAGTTLRGGCAGHDGTTANKRGNGGGVVMLAATGTITITGTINASGASGAAGPGGGATGSGGGSGGMIVIEATTIANNGMVFANGGSGSEANGAATQGKDGVDPGIAGAPFGTGLTTNGGDGGDGGVKPPPGNGDGGKGGNGNAGGGGGGGGGGVGVIHAAGLGGAVSPNPS